MTKQESYKRENHLMLANRLREILEMAGFTVEKKEDDPSMVVTTKHGVMLIRLVQIAPSIGGFVLPQVDSELLKASPIGYKITFLSGIGEAYPIKKWIGVKFDEEIGNWWFEPEKIVPKLKSIISGFDDFLSKEKETKSIVTKSRERLEKMFSDYHVSHTGTTNLFTVENRTFGFSVWVSEGFSEGKTDEITTSAITVRRDTEDLKDTPQEFLKKLTLIDEVLHGRVITKPKWAITQSDVENHEYCEKVDKNREAARETHRKLLEKDKALNEPSKRKVKDAAITYLRLKDYTSLSYIKIAELIRAELGSKTTAKSIAWYYSKFKESEKLLPRSKKQT